MKVLKVYNKDIHSAMRFDSSYHLSEGTIYLRNLRKMPHKELSDVTLSIFTAGRSKRVYTDEEFGFPYLSNSDVVKHNPLDGCKYNSKKFGYDEASFLKEGMVVTGRVGAIGQTAYITSDLEESKAMGSDNIIRIVPLEKEKSGYIYAFFASKFGNTLLWRLAAGGVQPYISEDMLRDIPIPDLTESKQLAIHNLIVDASRLRVEANKLLKVARSNLKKAANLPPLKTTDYEYFGNQSQERKVSVFKRNIKEISTKTINAFNYSKRVEAIENRVKKGKHFLLLECLNENTFFSSGSFRRLELDSPNSIRLLNQSDIFNLRKQGKLLARLYVKSDKLVEYGEVLIAGVGTLGESETFCRTIFANEELEGQLISGEFIRMKTNDKIPSGYLYAWLSSDYGFRFIRKTQTGTKLCRPIQELLKNIPVPIIDKESMLQIDTEIKTAHTMFYEALKAESKAIELVENEIESWQKS